jgi:hypothetical protein
MGSNWKYYGNPKSPFLHKIEELFLIISTSPIAR